MTKIQLTRELAEIWDGIRLVKAGWCSLPDLDLMTFDDVDLYCQALDAVEDAAPEG